MKRYEGLKNLRGPLVKQPVVMAKLDRFFDRPSAATWGAVYQVIIGGGTLTFWRAVCEVLYEFPREVPEGGWNVYPDDVTARRALEYARKRVLRDARSYPRIT